jgi:hypothetical protein
MKLLFFTAVLSLLSHNLWARSIECSVVGAPSTSTIRIDFDENEAPIASYLRSPESNEYRQQNVTFKEVHPFNDELKQSFSVYPNFTQTIHWSIEPNCFKEVGTQWYFNLHFGQARFGVYLAPHYVTESASCIPPRNPPQFKELSCLEI